MKKYGKRIAAFALSVVVALGSVCYKPPKAEAAVLESMVANMFLTSYMSATGFDFAPDNATAERLGYALESLIPDFVLDYSVEVGEFTTETFYNIINQNCVIQTNGILQIAHQAAALMGRFTAWLITQFDLIGKDGKPVVNHVNVVPNFCDYALIGDVYRKIPTDWDRERFPYAVFGLIGKCDDDPDGWYFCFQAFDEPLTYTGRSSDDSAWLFQHYGAMSGVSWIVHADGSTTYGGLKTYEENSNLIVTFFREKMMWSNYDIQNRNGNLALAAKDFTLKEDSENPILSVGLGTDYTSLPPVGENYSLVIDTGLTYEDEDTFIESVLGGAAAGTFAPTYTIENSTTGDVVVPDEDEKDTGILNWVKNIWQSVQDVPKAIADAVANVFVPSAEYMAALPATVTSTFDNRTGFLTYPVSVLYDFADKLSSGSQDFILKWPTVIEPYSGGQLMPAGQFNVSKYVRDNGFASDIYTIYQWVMGGYLTFLFFGLCRRKYNSVIGDRLGG